MKKQILFLSFFVLATLAGVTNVFGQMRPSTKAPNPLTNCVGSPLNPIAGTPYDYSVEIGNGVTPSSYTWWATKNPNFIDLTTFAADTTSKLMVKPAQLLGTGPLYADKTNTAATMSITWSQQVLDGTDYDITGSPSPTFVVVKADDGCTNNLKVFEINPTPSFTLDIANINPADTTDMAYLADASQCVDIVRGAKYESGGITMDYGADTLLFEVIAANFVESWIPTFQIMDGLNTGQTATIGWAYTKKDAFDGNFIETEQAIATTVTGTTNLVAASGVNISAGVSIYVRIIIDNNKYESLAQSDFTLAVDGRDADNNWDIDQAGTDCAPTSADQTDVAVHTITPRPQLDDTTGDGALNATEPNTYDPQNP